MKHRCPKCGRFAPMREQDAHMKARCKAHGWFGESKRLPVWRRLLGKGSLFASWKSAALS